MKTITCFLVVLAFFVVGCDDSQDIIETSQKKQDVLRDAQQWVKDSKLDATVTCNRMYVGSCDVIPKDPRPPILLWCNRNGCRVDYER